MKRSMCEASCTGLILLEENLSHAASARGRTDDLSSSFRSRLLTSKGYFFAGSTDIRCSLRSVD